MINRAFCCIAFVLAIEPGDNSRRRSTITAQTLSSQPNRRRRGASRGIPADADPLRPHDRAAPVASSGRTTDGAEMRCAISTLRGARISEGHDVAIEFDITCPTGAWDIGHISLFAGVVGCPQSFWDHRWLLHDERPNGCAVFLHGFRISDFARPIAEIRPKHRRWPLAVLHKPGVADFCALLVVLSDNSGWVRSRLLGFRHSFGR